MGEMKNTKDGRDEKLLKVGEMKNTEKVGEMKNN